MQGALGTELPEHLSSIPWVSTAGQQEYPVCRSGAQGEPTFMAVQGHLLDQCVPTCFVSCVPSLRAVV